MRQPYVLLRQRSLSLMLAPLGPHLLGHARARLQYAHAAHASCMPSMSQLGSSLYAFPFPLKMAEVGGQNSCSPIAVVALER